MVDDVVEDDVTVDNPMAATARRRRCLCRHIQRAIGDGSCIATEDGVHEKWYLSHHRPCIRSKGGVNSNKALVGALTLAGVVGRRDSRGSDAGPRGSG